MDKQLDLLTNSLGSLSIEEDSKIDPRFILINTCEFGIGPNNSKNYINSYYTEIDIMMKNMSKGILFDKKELIVSLVKITVLYDKIIQFIMKYSSNYSNDIIVNKLDKLKPEYFLNMLVTSIPKEYFDVIYLNYNYYLVRYNNY